MMMNRGAMIATLAVACMIGASTALADDYAFDLGKANGKAMQAFQRLVPARFKRTAWIYRFAGTTSPMQRVTYQGRPFLLGEVCKPHDCAGNEVAFLIAVDGSAAYGLLRS